MGEKSDYQNSFRNSDSLSDQLNTVRWKWSSGRRNGFFLPDGETENVHVFPIKPT